MSSVAFLKHVDMAHLGAGRVPEIPPIIAEPLKVICVDHLVSEHVLGRRTVADVIGAEEDAVVLAKGALLDARGTERIASAADDVAVINLAAQLLDVGLEEGDRGRVLEEPVAPLLALAAVLFLADERAVVEVFLDVGVRGRADDASEKERPCVVGRVEGCVFSGGGVVWCVIVGVLREFGVAHLAQVSNE